MAEFELQIDKIKEMYDDRNNSKESADNYIMLMWEQLERLVTKRAIFWGSKVKGNPHASIEDLKSSAKVAIIEHLSDYDPHQSNPSTYFMQFIDDKMKECTNSRILQVSNHYIYGSSETEKVLREQGYDGLQDPRVTVKLIAQIMDYPTKRASIIYENARRSFCSLDDPSWIEDSMSESPEEKAIKAENVASLLEACSKLTPLEQYLIEQFYVNDVKSTRLVVSALRKSQNLLKKYSLNQKQVTGKFITQIKHKALAKLRAESENRKTNTLSNAEVYEQASAQDLADAAPQIAMILN